MCAARTAARICSALRSRTAPSSSCWYSWINWCRSRSSSYSPAGANDGVWWLTVTARPRRRAWIASPTLSWMYG